MGGDEGDYNEDGTIKNNVSKEVLENYCIVNDLVPNDIRCIFLQTKLCDLEYILNIISLNGNYDITDVFKEMGHKLRTYRHNEYGELVENSWIDEAIIRSNKQVDSEDLSNSLTYIFSNIINLIDEVSSLNKDQDNKDFFAKVPLKIQNIYNLNF